MNLVHAPTVDQVFEPSLLAVGAIAVFAEDAHHGGGDGDGLIRPEEQSAIAGELLMAGDSAKQHAKINARGNVFAVGNAHGDEADVVGIGQHADGSAIVEGDIELARQPI